MFINLVNLFYCIETRVMLSSHWWIISLIKFVREMVIQPRLTVLGKLLPSILSNPKPSECTNLEWVGIFYACWSLAHRRVRSSFKCKKYPRQRREGHWRIFPQLLSNVRLQERQETFRTYQIRHNLCPLTKFGQF